MKGPSVHRNILLQPLERPAKRPVVGQIIIKTNPNGTAYRYETIRPDELVRVPFGFSGFSRVRAFALEIDRTLRKQNIFDARLFIVGSAARGVAHRSKGSFSGKPYDQGRVSDVEIEVLSDNLAQRCFEIVANEGFRRSEQEADLQARLDELDTERGLLASNFSGKKSSALKKIEKEIRDLLGKLKVAQRKGLRLMDAAKNNRLQPNIDNVDWLVDLRMNLLPKFTDRPENHKSKAVGIRVSWAANARDLEKSSFLLVDQKMNVIVSEPDHRHTAIQTREGIQVL